MVITMPKTEIDHHTSRDTNFKAHLHDNFGGT